MKRSSVRFHLDADVFDDALKDLSIAVDAGLPNEIVEQFVAAVYAGADVVTVQVDDTAAPRTRHIFLVAKPSKLLTKFMSAVRADNPDPAKVRKALRHLQASIPNGDNATTKWQPYKRDALRGWP